MNAELEWKLANLPDSPGCYLMKSKGEIIYVGKAKNLKNRVSPVLPRPSRTTRPRCSAMVEKIDDFDIVLVDGRAGGVCAGAATSSSATCRTTTSSSRTTSAYPYIRVDLYDDFPRIELARRQERDGARYFGPYQGATAVPRGHGRGCAWSIRIRDLRLRDPPGQAAAGRAYNHQIGQLPGALRGPDTSPRRPTGRRSTGAHRTLLHGKYKPVLDALKARMAEAGQGDELRARRRLPRPHPRRRGAACRSRRPSPPTHADQRRHRRGSTEEADALVRLLLRALRPAHRLGAVTRSRARATIPPGEVLIAVHAAVLRRRRTSRRTRSCCPPTAPEQDDRSSSC